MGFSRQGYRSGLPFPSPGNLPDPGIEAWSAHYRQIIHHLSHQGCHIVLFKGNETCVRSKTPEHFPQRGNAVDVDAQSQFLGELDWTVLTAEAFTGCRAQSLGHAGFTSCST